MTAAWSAALAQAVGEPPPWHAEALCAQVGGDFWFLPETGGFPQESKRAKALCGQCPVARACLSEAWARDERHGIWGGFNMNNRRERDRAAKALGTDRRATRRRTRAA